MRLLLAALAALALNGCAMTEKQQSRAGKACYGLLLIQPVALGVAAAVACDIATDELPTKSEEVEVPNV